MKYVVDIVAAFFLIVVMVVVSAFLFIGGLVILVAEFVRLSVMSVFRSLKKAFNKSNGGEENFAV